ncbi:MAG: glycosyltransferase family 4 protein [Acidobacteriaceae bacterium]|nr:glycosyltransferase family 4 protein [Acidobacteriaceae bacterium]MBV9782135.1 glycosyltransferase family 4 protein [Acidobacteriaceae bacterium]
MTASAGTAENEICLIHVFTLAQSCGFLSGQCRFLGERGFRIHVISAPGRQLDQLRIEDGVTVHRVSMDRVISPLHDLMSIYQLYSIFRRERPDIVHGHTPKASLLSAIAARLARVPVYVHHLHGLRHSTRRGVERSLLYWSEYLTCKLSKRVYCVSKSLFDQALREKLFGPTKARVLLNGSVNGIDAQGKFNPARYAFSQEQIREELRIPSRARVIGFVARLAHDKGIEELTRAWGEIHAECPEAVLVVVGGLDKSDPPQAATMACLQRDPDVRLVGDTDDVGKYLSIMEVLLFPTHREGFGLVAAEANAMEVPVVTFAVTGCVDAIVDGETGTLVPAGDADALARAAIYYLRNENSRQEHGRNGRVRVLRDFDQHRLWRALWNEYVETLGVPALCERTTAES